MLAIEVRLLTGRYAAAAFKDRTKSEWPPHPARLYSAAVAAWAEGGQDESERLALKWLEEQPPPLITCSPEAEVSTRAPVTHFVPGNDASSVRDVHRLGLLISSAVEAELIAKSPSAKLKASGLSARLRAKAESDSNAAGVVKSVSNAVMSKQLQLLPENRNRQARYYPAVRPDSELIRFTWADANVSDQVVVALDATLSRIGRLGHSSSLVTCRAIITHEGADEDATHEPGRAGPDSQMIRVPAPELLEELIALHGQHQGREPRTLPAAFVSYVPRKLRQPVLAVPANAGDWIIFEIDRNPEDSGLQRALSINRVAELTRTLRSALISHSPEPVPPLLSGHRGTTRNDDDHAMFLALPNVGSLHSDGTVTAMALALPIATSPAEFKDVFEAVSRFHAAGGVLRWSSGGVQLKAGRNESAFTPPFGDRFLKTTTRNYWARPSRAWTTVTPIALDRFPRAVRRKSGVDWAAVDAQVSDIVVESCRHVGLPEPVAVDTIPGPPSTGIPAVGAASDGPSGRRFGFYRAAGSRQLRYSVHVAIRFADAICGPLVLGAGRHFGYGLLLPAGDGGRAQ